MATSLLVSVGPRDALELREDAQRVIAQTGCKASAQELASALGVILHETLHRSKRLEWACSHGGNSKKAGAPFDLIAAFSLHPILVVTLGSYLDPADFFTLYRTSRDFHDIVDSSLTSCFKTWLQEGETCASDSAQIATPHHYPALFVADPAGRTGEEYTSSASPERIRSVPSVKAGFRLPAGTSSTLLKLWVFMNGGTNSQRSKFMRDPQFMSDQDLVYAYMFFVKLALLFTDPFYGPNMGPKTCELLGLMMAQRNFCPLHSMLFGHKYRTVAELLRLRVRHDMKVSIPPHTQTILGVPESEVATGQLERRGGPGRRDHLNTPIESVVVESARRGLRLDTHIFHFLLWGHIDYTSGRTIWPSEKETHICDDEHVNRSADTTAEVKPFHCHKGHWESLSQEEQDKVADDEETVELYIAQQAAEEPMDTEISGWSKGRTSASGRKYQPSEITQMVGSAFEVHVQEAMKHLDGHFMLPVDKEGEVVEEHWNGCTSSTDLALSPQLENLAPSTSSRPSPYSARFRFPTRRDYDDKRRSAPFTGVPPPIEEVTLAQGNAWGMWRTLLDQFWTVQHAD
ncbi:hypothetical protein F5Y18DRAFT_433390 [Xylariaceae sp. FL1019]|nr:hypothetical protein F5Y18DRAFT_433390 [Xylariaceae sp. FL1019]